MQLSHAIDGRGRHIDAKGEVRDWWSPGEAATWEALAKNVTALYAGLPYPGLSGTRVDVALTRDENIADLAGLELAHAALLAARPDGGAQVDKAFYTGWAHLWAQQVTRDEAEIRARQDVRAPGPWRANAVVMQQPAFGAAYACKAGMPMQPKADERVTVFK